MVRCNDLLGCGRSTADAGICDEEGDGDNWDYYVEEDDRASVALGEVCMFEHLVDVHVSGTKTEDHVGDDRRDPKRASVPDAEYAQEGASEVREAKLDLKWASRVPPDVPGYVVRDENVRQR